MQAASVLLGMVQGVAIIAQMGLMAWLIHVVLVEGVPIDALLWPFLLLGCALVVRALGQALQDILGQRASAQVRQRVRARLVSSWAAIGPVRLAERSSATLANQFVEQVEALDGFYARYLPQQWLALLVPLMIGAVVLWLDWLAALFLLFSAPLIPVFMALVGISAEKLSQQHVLEAGRLSGHFLDRVRNLTSLQLFGRVPAAIADVQVAADRYRQVTMRTLRVAFLSSAVLEFFASVAIAVVAMYIGFGLLGYIDYGPSGQLTLFSGLFVLLLAPEFFQPLRSLAQHYHDRAAALGAADVLSALEAQAQQRDASPTQIIGRDESYIALTDVTLEYPGRGLALKGVTLTIRRAEIIALVGPSGSGKSSLLHCLAGFVQPLHGQITLFGQAAGEKPIAWLGQRPFLVQGSWADNLRLTAPDADVPSMLAAVKAVGLDEVLDRLPDGLNSPLAEGGGGLSGGQAQRLALARVWLTPAELVLLDEPTASLDEASEAEVIRALQALAATGRTLIIATHHQALMTMASRRITLAQGAISNE